MIGPGSAIALDFDTDSDWKVRWDNTLKYSNAFRVSPRNQSLLAGNINGDDGDRDFSEGLISDRFDILSELDISYHNFGVSISGAAWYDTVYNQKTANNSPGTYNPITVPSNTFSNGTRDVDGREVQLLNAFVYGGEQLGDETISFRLGRHTLLWGESLLIPTNGVAYGQAPLDVVKLLSVPNTLAKELFMPVNQLSSTVQFKNGFSLQTYTQFEWEKTRLPGVGSYFSFLDAADAGGERIFAGNGLSFDRSYDAHPNPFGQWGAALRYSSDELNTDFGLYAVTYADKLPQVALQIAPNFPAGKLGNYYLVYPEDAHIFGLSASTDIGDLNIGGEISGRTNAPLVSTPQVTPTLADASHPPGAIGDSFAAQVSAIYLLPPSDIWDGGDFAGEIAYNRRLSISANPKALDPTTRRDALGLRFLFNPTWYQVMPGVDLTVPLGLGYNPLGNSSVVQVFNGGENNGGDLTTGISFIYKNEWRGSLTYTRYFGNGDWNSNYYVDRDFVAFSIQRTF